MCLTVCYTAYMQATDSQIQPNLKRAETSDHVSRIRTAASTTKQQLSRFSMAPNKIAYDLTEDRSAGPAVSTLAQLRRCWRHRGGVRGKVASNLLPGPVNGAEGNPCENVCEAPTITSATDMEQTGREAVESGEDLVHKLNPALMLEKQASALTSLAALYLGRRSPRALPSRKIAALPVGNVAAQPGAPTAPVPQPSAPQNLPPGMMAQQAGLPTGAGVQGAAAAMPPGSPPPGAGASGPPPGGAPAAAPPLPAGQEQVAAAGAQPDPNIIQAPPPKPPSPLGRGQHLDTITSDSRKHPLNQLMDDAQQSEHQSSPDDHEEEGEDTSTIGGGGATRIKEAAVDVSVTEHPLLRSLFSQRPNSGTSGFIPLTLSMQWRKEGQVKRAQWRKQSECHESLVGGKADKKPDSAFSSSELHEGIEEEAEHTGDIKTRKEIAKDHLAEDPRYYTKLERMEEGSAKEAGDTKKKSKLGRNLAIGAGVVGGGAALAMLARKQLSEGARGAQPSTPLPKLPQNDLGVLGGQAKQAEAVPASGPLPARQISNQRGLFGQPTQPFARRYTMPARPPSVAPSFMKGMGRGAGAAGLGMAGLAALSQIYKKLKPQNTQPTAPAMAQ